MAVLAGCGKRNETTGIITVDVNASYPEKELILQDFMDVEYIPLETNDEFINRACVQAVGEKYITFTMMAIFSYMAGTEKLFAK